MDTDRTKFIRIKEVTEKLRIVTPFVTREAGCALVMCVSEDTLIGRVYAVYKPNIQHRAGLAFVDKDDLLAEIADLDVEPKVDTRDAFGKEYRGHYPQVEYMDDQARTHRRS